MNHVTGKENVLDFPEREIKNKERSICASGFFSIPNELADKLCSTRLSDQKHRVLFAVMRRTIGYHKLVDWVSLEQLHEMTDIKKPNLSKTIKTLLERRILIREGRKLGINQTVSEWVDKVRTLSKQITKVMPIDNDCYADRQPNHEQKVMPMDNAVIQTDNNCYADRQPQKNTILQNTNIKKRNKKKTLKPPDQKSSTPPVDFSVFEGITSEQISELKRIRKANKGGPISQRVANQLAKEFIRARQYGFTLDDCLTEWETRSWKSFKAAWVAPKELYHSKPYPDFHSGDTSWAKDLGW
ncbi:conserved hypothetical protein [Vibrio nigripulchritudo SOn1]|uniref:Bacteriophage lambda Replication protein O N-terminal domain-containing protein n=1 Tax=Vibrio nigripulchritudo SOn1 TaxID=1238450 RepID=A0AAV2VJC2_9VIBR|nr:replication protein [Vibrio nigripulchritudo]CCO44762.1 conserved hypothetical protein [Vibrio nigripulchritudo SOn1]